MNIKRILASVKGDSIDDELVRLATDLAKRSKATLFIIHVIEVRQALSLDAYLPEDVERGERALDHAERVAEQSGFEVEAELLQARSAGAAIVDEAIERNVDLIMMGLSYRKRFGQFDLGRTIPYVLKNAPCRVWLIREPMS